MTVWALLRAMLRQVLRGRGGDAVYLCVHTERDGLPYAATGEDVTLVPQRLRQDAFCVLVSAEAKPPHATGGQP